MADEEEAVQSSVVPIAVSKFSVLTSNKNSPD